MLKSTEQCRAPVATVSSARTLAAAGCGAKRLLAHTNLSVISECMSFHHATAFRAWGVGIPLATRHLGGSQPAAGDSPKDFS